MTNGLSRKVASVVLVSRRRAIFPYESVGQQLRLQDLTQLGTGPENPQLIMWRFESKLKFWFDLLLRVYAHLERAAPKGVKNALSPPNFHATKFQADNIYGSCGVFSPSRWMASSCFIHLVEVTTARCRPLVPWNQGRMKCEAEGNRGFHVVR